MTNTEILHRWFDQVWNNKNEAAIYELFADDGVAEGLGDEPVVGPDNFTVFQRAFLSAYPDLRVEITDTVTEGDKVAVRFRVTGLHAGEGLGVQPTNNPVDFNGMTLARIRDGKIVEAWNNVDFMQMFQQLGVAGKPDVTERNKHLVREWFEQVWNEKDPSLIDVIMTDDTVHHDVLGPDGGEMKGRESFRSFYNSFLKSFPDIHFDIRDVVAEGNRVAARYVATGTQHGPVPGFDQVTGAKVRFTGGGICTIEDGHFVEVWNEIDFYKMHYDLDPNTQTCSNGGMERTKHRK